MGFDAVFYHYRRKKCGFLAVREQEVTVLAFIPKDDMQRIVYFNYNGLSALFVKEGIQKIVLYSIRGPGRGNPFSQHV